MEPHVTEVLRLGFGRCALRVQVPEHGPIQRIEDLAGKRVVTSFENLAGDFFEKVDSRLGLQGDERTKIEYVGGSVEAACALGLADGIVDLVGEFEPFFFEKREIKILFRIRRNNACGRVARYRHHPRKRSCPHPVNDRERHSLCSPH